MDRQTGAGQAFSGWGELAPQRVREIRTYERAHKARAGILQATETELSNA